jgi:hypothetical protein
MTLFSSTTIPSPSPLFSSHLDRSHPDDSIIKMLPDDAQSNDTIPKASERGAISHRVMHIQGPDIANTFIQAGCGKAELKRRTEKKESKEGDCLPLGINLSWMGMHIKRLGRRDLAFEVGMVDARGREGIIRISSFKVCPGQRCLSTLSQCSCCRNSQQYTSIGQYPFFTSRLTFPPGQRSQRHRGCIYLST